jgi:hypothetical protein
LEALAAAAAEITRELAPGSVELRLRGADPEFVVAAPAAFSESASGRAVEDAIDTTEAWAFASASATVGEGGVARINLRLPDQLKARVEQAAEREGLSINAWLVRAAAAAVERSGGGPRGEQGMPRGGQRFTGWGR